MLSHFVTIITATFNIVNFITIIISSILDLSCTKRPQTIIMSETVLFFSQTHSLVVTMWMQASITAMTA